MVAQGEAEMAIVVYDLPAWSHRLRAYNRLSHFGNDRLFQGAPAAKSGRGSPVKASIIHNQGLARRCLKWDAAYNAHIKRTQPRLPAI